MLTRFIVSITALFTLADAFDINGVGGYEYTLSSKAEPIMVTDVLRDKKNTSVNAISMWMTRDWDATWYPAAEVNQLIVQRGYTPIFILYWFADDISIQYIHEHRNAYFDYLKRIRNYLDQVEGKKIIVLNPEYNEQDVSGWDGFNDLLLDSKAVLDRGDIIIGPCIGDFGDYSRAYDPENWKNFDKSLNRAIASFDFIAFQEMRSLTKNKPSEIETLPQRIEAFSNYLNKTYKKPVFLAYLALSTWGENGEALQENVMKTIVDKQNLLQKNGLMGMNVFHLADVPTHVGFFEEGEKYFGFLHADLSKKNSFNYLENLKTTNHIIKRKILK